MTPLLVPAALALAKDPVPTESEIGPGLVYPLVFGVIVLASVLLWLNMRKQLRKIHLPEEEGAQQPSAPGSADDAERR